MSSLETYGSVQEIFFVSGTQNIDTERTRTSERRGTKKGNLVLGRVLSRGNQPAFFYVGGGFEEEETRGKEEKERLLFFEGKKKKTAESWIRFFMAEFMILFREV